MKACESRVVESHFHSEVELQVELYSCGCCDGEEPCPHGYGYEELEVDDYFHEQSTIFLSDKDDESVDVSIDNMEIPVKLTKNQEKNLKRCARKQFNGVEEINEHEPPEKNMP